jgi:transposase
VIPHAVRRARERLGTDDGLREVSALKAAVLQGRAKFLRPGRGCRSIWRARVDGMWVIFVWQEDVRRVITVLEGRGARSHDEERERKGKNHRRVTRSGIAR